jgi:hypothetical protein
MSLYSSSIAENTAHSIREIAKLRLTVLASQQMLSQRLISIPSFTVTEISVIKLDADYVGSEVLTAV